MFLFVSLNAHHHTGTLQSAAACELLLSMSKVRRFDLVASFLFGKDKKLAEEVLHWLKSEGVQGVGPLMSLFGVSG